MTNWKTTAAAIFTALFAFIVFSPDTFAGLPWLVNLAKFATAGGLMAFGILAKDSDVTGGTKQQ
jgi:hypothetical protein